MIDFKDQQKLLLIGLKKDPYRELQNWQKRQPAAKTYFDREDPIILRKVCYKLYIYKMSNKKALNSIGS